MMQFMKRYNKSVAKFILVFNNDSREMPDFC